MPPIESVNSLLLIIPFTAKDELVDSFQVKKLKDFQQEIGRPFSVVYICDDVPTKLHLIALEKIKNKFSDFMFISHGKNLGKGAALKTGMQLSTNYTHTIYTDVDFPYDLRSMLDVYGAVNQGFDFVIGTRHLESASYPIKQRRMLTSILRGMNRLLIGKKFEDTQAGLKGYSSRACSSFQFLSFDRYLFDWQCVRHAAKVKDMRVTQIQIKLRDDYVQKHFSSMNILRECKDVATKVFRTIW